MKIKHKISVVDTHTGGEPTRIVVGGYPRILGQTMLQKRAYAEEHYDDLRTMIMREPRGHKDMFGAILTEPVNESSHYGVLFLSTADFPEGYPVMCGHGTIGVATVLVELGMIPKVEPVTEVILDTPNGTVKANVNICHDEVESVTVQCAPAYVLKENCQIEVPNLGTVPFDIVVSGNVFAIVPVEVTGLSILPENANELMRLGILIRDEINRQLSIEVPGRPKHLSIVNQVDFTEKINHADQIVYRNVLIFGDGSVDRSPCGTGTAAKVTVLHQKGLLKQGEKLYHEGIVGSTFIGEIIETFEEDQLIKCVNSVTSSAFITGFNELIATDKDPFFKGFLI